jgi:hypothetical protein
MNLHLPHHQLPVVQVFTPLLVRCQPHKQHSQPRVQPVVHTVHSIPLPGNVSLTTEIKTSKKKFTSAELAQNVRHYGMSWDSEGKQLPKQVQRLEKRVAEGGIQLKKVTLHKMCDMSRILEASRFIFVHLIMIIDELVLDLSEYLVSDQYEFKKTQSIKQVGSEESEAVEPTKREPNIFPYEATPGKLCQWFLRTTLERARALELVYIVSFHSM